MRRVWALFLVVLLSVPAPAVWATPTQFGDSGLISQPSADTHQSGSICVGLWSNYATLKNGVNEESTLLLPISITLGLGSFIEAYGSYPNLSFNGDEGENITAYPVSGYSDRGFANIGLKTRVLGSRSGPFRFSLDGQARRNVSDDPTVDGLTDYLTRGVMTLKYGMFGLHANGGYLISDKDTDADHVVYGAGLEFVPTPRLRFMAEYETAQYEGDDTLLSGLESPAEATFGVQYHISPHLALSAAYAQGLSDYSPDWRTIVGFYTCQGTGTYIKPVTAVPEIPEEESAPVAEPVKMLKLNTLSPLATLRLPAAEGVDPVSEFEVPVKAGEEEIVITPNSDYRLPEGVERVRDEVDATPATSPGDDEAIPFTTVMAAAAGAAVTQVAPLPVAPAALSAPEPADDKVSGGRSYAMREYVYDGGQIIGQKIEEELAYKTYFLTLEPQGEFLVGEFYHDAAQSLPVWIEGPVDYNLSFELLKPFTLTKLKVRLTEGDVPAFKLHIGERSEVFQFGPPGMWQQSSAIEGIESPGLTESVVVAESVETLADAETKETEPESETQQKGDSLAAKIGKGVLLAPVAVVAAPFVGAAYLAQKAVESSTGTAAGAAAASGAATTATAQGAATVAAGGTSAGAQPLAASAASGSSSQAAGIGSTAATVTSVQTAAGHGAIATQGAAAAVTTAGVAAGSAQTAATTAGSAGTMTVAPAQGAASVAAGTASAGAQPLTASTASGSGLTAGTGSAAATVMSAGAASGTALNATTTAGSAGATTILPEENVEPELEPEPEVKPESLAAKIGKGVLLAPVAVVAAPFVGAAYLAQKATGTAPETAGAAVSGAAVTAAGAAAAQGAATTAGSAGSTTIATAQGAATQTAGTIASPTFGSQSIQAASSRGRTLNGTDTVQTAVSAPVVAAVVGSSGTASTRHQTASTQSVAPAGSAAMAAQTASSGPVPSSGQTMKTTVYRKYRLPEFTFELGLWDLSEEGRRALSMVMDRLRKLDKWFLVRIDGHTDSTGPANYNEMLAMQRAISVATHLVANEGLNPEVVFLKGFGERKPFETNATREGRHANRRIELLVLIPKES